jgi:type I restriction enzyme S subunit
LEDIERVMPPRGSEGERTKVASGDVLISITAFIGSIGVVPDEFEEAYVSQHIALVRIKPSGTHPKWIGYSLLSELGAIQSNLMMYGGTKVGLSLGDVKNYCFPVPPQNEQVDIVEHIAAVFSGYTRGVSQFEKEIQSLKILRSTLIAHAVTGRIKV